MVMCIKCHKFPVVSVRLLMVPEHRWLTLAIHNTVESGHYLYRCANWSLYPGGVKTGECPC